MRSPAAVAWSGFAVLAVAMGIGRFAFTPLLPMMQADAGLSLGEASALALANYGGYLAGALWAARQRATGALALRLALAAIGFSTLAMAWAHEFPAWFAWRFVAGVASAWALVHVSAWALARLASAGRPALAGLVYAGVGGGIVFAGLVCLIAMAGHAASRWTWMALGIAALLVAAGTWKAFSPSNEARQTTQARIAWDPPLPRLIACYGALGLGYIIPATYLPAMAREALRDPLAFGWTWPAFGAAAAASTILAGALSRRVDQRRLWAGAHLVMALGVAAPLFVPGLAGILIAAASVGGTFMIATMSGLQAARTAAGAHGARAMAAMTSAFAAGQIAGPALVAALTRSGATLGAALALSAAALALSAMVLLQKEPPHERAAAQIPL
ncbi:MAG: YbfB/YjiJ family MFS transporter [Betaproteobacteria bacterium]|nr:YbfB/YjiJ family MFS transporter [Betaproteobacteria bacterium]